MPPPFAFNYHFDGGQFRGLAFANFRHPADAALAVTALNGYDLQGRKLRTEYKKVLKEGEKERIEREKAIKRMRSQQQLPGSMGPPNGSDGPPIPIGTWNRREASAPGGYGYAVPPQSVQDEDDFGRVVQGQYSAGFGGRFMEYGSSPPSDVGTSVSQRMVASSSGSGSETGGQSSRAGAIPVPIFGTCTGTY